MKPQNIRVIVAFIPIFSDKAESLYHCVQCLFTCVFESALSQGLTEREHTMILSQKRLIDNKKLLGNKD